MIQRTNLTYFNRHCIEVLWLQGRNYNDSMCQEISKCQKLRELGLNHVESITPYGLKHISSLTKLEKLLLFHANNISPICFIDFFSNKNLRNLNYVNLSGCKGADDQVKRIIRRYNLLVYSRWARYLIPTKLGTARESGKLYSK